MLTANSALSVVLREVPLISQNLSVSGASGNPNIRYLTALNWQ
jgi:hypothetical protein